MLHDKLHGWRKKYSFLSLEDKLSITLTMARTPIRTPNRTPLRPSRKNFDLDESVTPVSTIKKLHRKFSQDDEPLAQLSEPDTPEEIEEEEEEEDSDEAPEEESIDTAAETARLREKAARKTEQDLNAKEKQRRRDRDLALKKRKEESSSSSKMLSLDIFDEIDREEEHSKQQRIEEQRLRAARIAASRKHKRLDDSKTMVHKGPVTVQVLEKKKKLAPSNEGVVSRVRDRFLHRRSVMRR
jgi:U3 small nucleolar RNA-associated protein 16